MSNHHARLKQRKNFGSILVPGVVVASVIFALIASQFYQRYLKSRVDPAWPSVAGKTIETRITVIGTQPQMYKSGVIEYRAEAHVIYELNGVHHDAWVPASGIETDRSYLTFWLWLRKSKEALIYWNPRNPSDVQAVLN